MSPRIQLSLACGDYEIMRALKEGTVRPDGIDLKVLTAMDSPTRHWRFLRNGDFDMAEVSCSSYIAARDRGLPFRALPVFPHRRFRHGFAYINTSKGIKKPTDLIGRKVGVKFFLISAALWMRGILEHEYGVPFKSIKWFTELDEDVDLALPPEVSITRVPPSKSIVGMLVDGELDAVLHADLIKPIRENDPRVGRLFPDYKTEEMAYYKKTGVFPIMHTLGIKQEIVDKYPWVPINMYQALERIEGDRDAAHGEPAHRAAGVVPRGLGGAGRHVRHRSVAIRIDRGEPQDPGDAGGLFLRAGPDQAQAADGGAVPERLAGRPPRR